jgi:lipoprotein NlpD
MKKLCLLLSLALIILIEGCNTPRRPAPVIDRGTSSRSHESGRASVATSAPQRIVDQHGFYIVRRGDTLRHIALEFGQNYLDLVTWNNLANANDLRVDQQLRVMPPDATTSTVQVGSVNGSTGVEVRPLGSVPATVAGAAPIAIVPNKIGPRGDKRPYSDAALAELQRPESSNYTGAAPSAVAPSTAIAVPKPVDVKATDKSVSQSTSAVSEDDNIAWIWPTEGKISARFEEGKKGIDIAGRSGQPVLAASAGKVMYAGSGIRGYGNLVIVKHTTNLLSAYAHNKTILVKEGQTVSRGQKIAEMGNSDTDAVKLHFEIRQQGKPVDPTKFLPAH